MLVVRQIIRNKQVLLMEVMEKIKFIEIIVWQWCLVCFLLSFKYDPVVKQHNLTACKM